VQGKGRKGGYRPYEQKKENTSYYRGRVKKGVFFFSPGEREEKEGGRGGKSRAPLRAVGNQRKGRGGERRGGGKSLPFWNKKRKGGGEKESTIRDAGLEWWKKGRRHIFTHTRGKGGGKGGGRKIVSERGGEGKKGGRGGFPTCYS